VEKDLIQARRYLCRTRTSSAKNSYYLVREGVEKEVTQMVQTYHQDAEKNDPETLYNLGDCYFTGVGVTKDMTQAGVEIDMVQAFHYYHLATNQGSLDA